MSDRFVHEEHVWGTVVVIDIRLHRASRRNLDVAISEVSQWLHDVDAVFSTFKSDSIISQLRTGIITEEEVDAGVADVIARCRRMVDITDGTFDPWAVDGGFDPSGLVKGWAADRAADVLTTYGYHDFMINAAGDLAIRGFVAPNTPWSIGIQHPYEHDQISGTVELTDCAIATSGLYERGNHIVSPHGSTIAASSATVIGSDCATADALATALLIAGREGFTWFNRLPGWSGQVIIDNTVISHGPSFASR